MASLAKLRVQLEELQEQRAKLEKQMDEANRQYKVGLWGILIGILLLPAYGIGLLFLLAGLLAAGTNRGKRARLQKEIEEVERQIRHLRIQIAESEETQETRESQETQEAA